MMMYIDVYVGILISLVILCLIMLVQGLLGIEHEEYDILEAWRMEDQEIRDELDRVVHR